MATLVSSVTSHFPKPQDGFTTTTSGSVSGGASTVGLNSTGNYSNGDIVCLIIDPGDVNKKQAFVGTMDTSGSQVTGVVWTSGTNQSHAAGATVVDYYSATHVQMMTKGLLVQHKQDGTHADTITTNIINENTTGNGVTIDGLLVKDSKLATANSVGTSNYTADSVPATAIDFASNSGDANGGIWWEEIGRTTLGSAADTITVSPLPARKYLKIFVYALSTNSISGLLRFNNDSGNNYAYRTSTDGGADATTASTSAIGFGAAGTTNFLAEITIINIAAQEKQVIGTHQRNAAGASNPPARRESVGKWANTSDQITRIDVVNDQAGDFASGSEVIVLGHN